MSNYTHEKIKPKMSKEERDKMMKKFLDKLKRSGIVMFHNHSKRSDAIKSHANINAMKNKTINVSSLS